ncbi:DUF3408 domain-containing protein [Hymenobacter sp. HDW8]|uniref:DUF3408 domain-containing protein n=1 Tax=Hymenobacter sp. HDW8 TaxID=2714932 RepID=UPI00140A2E71|nr:DUF3408 domain-containing protein [Hymenobacter sp. HDW8]QIL78331.1 DUF3408 domain-containing protein [Hymenobacter sp. HDW8]
MATNDDELVDVLQAASRRRHPGALPTPEPAAPTPPVAAPGVALSAPSADAASTTHRPELTPSERPPGKRPHAAPPPPPAAPTPADYRRQLLQAHRHKKGKTIQLDPDNHRALTHIANTMGGITIADLLHNIVCLHFQEYGPTLQQMLQDQEAQNKKEKLPFQRP